MSFIGDFNIISENLISIQEDILNNKKICKFLSYSNSFNPLSEPDIKRPHTLISQNKINTFPYIHEKTEDKISFINVYASNISKSYENPKTRKINISVIVVSHSDIWNTSNGLRPILLMNELDKIINGNKKLLSIGGVSFEFARPVEINKKFYGYEIMYSFNGFNNIKKEEEYWT